MKTIQPLRIALVASLWSLLAATAAADTIARLDDADFGELKSAAFELPAKTKVNITGRGIGHRFDKTLRVYGWILDADTRAPVWVMTRRTTDRDGRWHRVAEESIELDSGRYEVHLWASLPWGGVETFSNRSWPHLFEAFAMGFADRHDSWDADDEDSWDDDDDDRWHRDSEDSWEGEFEEETDEDDDRQVHRHRQRVWDDENGWVEAPKRPRDPRDLEDLRERLDARDRHRAERDSERRERRRRASEAVEDAMAECYIQLDSDGPANARTATAGPNTDGALIAVIGLGDSEYRQVAFALSEPTKLNVRSVFEYPKGSDGPADFGWITTADTYERVWQPKARRTKKAGGAKKNRLIDEEIELGRGSYILHFGTDDSHSAEEWNAAPPVDPLSWGIVVSAAPGQGRTAFRKTNLPKTTPVIQLTEVGDRELREQAFELGRPTRLLVEALGEYDDSDDAFADYGWIADAATNEPVWEMRYRNTMPAGGAEKNRAFTGLVELDAGSYVAYYVSDGSHSYEDWNSAAPFRESAWGLAIAPGPDASPSDIRLVQADQLPRDSKLLAKVVMVGDRERQRATFELEREGKVRILAVGEGMNGRMYDYAVIRDRQSGEAVWKMPYRRTRHAGGAEKNRIFDRTVELPAGSYEVLYRTDGSHSFAEWNAERPDEPWNWGVTIWRAE